MDAQRWQRLSPLLDSLFELAPGQRAQRLDELRAEDAEIAAELEALIALEEERTDFLAEPLVSAIAVGIECVVKTRCAPARSASDSLCTASRVRSTNGSTKPR